MTALSERLCDRIEAEWTAMAAAAYTHYREHGRGVVLLADDAPAYGYATAAEVPADVPGVRAAVAAYNPAREFVAVLADDDETACIHATHPPRGGVLPLVAAHAIQMAVADLDD